jgi:hypothetical protein
MEIGFSIPLSGKLPMLPSASFFAQQSRGPLLICAGLAIVLLAQVWPAVPIAAAIVLIGWGATLSLCARSNCGALSVMSLFVYASLGCYTIAAQVHAAANGPQGGVGALLVVDHLLAVALFVTLARYVMTEILSPPAFDP